MIRWKLACINWPHETAPHAVTYINAEGEAVFTKYHDTWEQAVAWLNENADKMHLWAWTIAQVREIRWRDRHGDIWKLGRDGLLHTPETRPFPPAHVEKKWGPLVAIPAGEEQS